MAYTYDEQTKEIAISAGDTMNIPVSITGAQYDAVLFVVYQRGGGDLVKIPGVLSNGSAVIRVANRHTQGLDEGRYKWNLRFISDPAYDENDEIIIDEDSDNVWTAFGPAQSDVPNFIVHRTGGVLASDIKNGGDLI